MDSNVVTSWLSLSFRLLSVGIGASTLGFLVLEFFEFDGVVRDGRGRRPCSTESTD